MQRWIKRISIWEAFFFLGCYGIGRSRLIAVTAWRIALVSMLSAAVVLLFVLGMMFLTHMIFKVD